MPEVNRPTLKRRNASAELPVEAVEMTVSPALEEWLDFQLPNACLAFTNLFYIAAAIAVVVLGIGVVNEHADDLKNNAFFTQNASTTTSPCGFPTPDVVTLLQATEELAAAGIPAALLEPDYAMWIGEVESVMCDIKVVPEPDSGWSAATGYATQYAEELLFFSSLYNDLTFEPAKEDFESGNDLETKRAFFENRACLTETAEDGTKPLYSAHERDIYGDFKVRVARAYLAAMPAFYKLRDGTCLGDKNPFNSQCAHAEHIGAEFQHVRLAQEATLLVTGGVASLPTFTTMLYRLFALAVFAYYDRKDNNGQCFRNDDVYADAITPTTTYPLGGSSPYGAVTNYKAVATALEACEAAFAQITDATALSGTALSAYNAQQDAIHATQGCTSTTNLPPPSPAPPILREQSEDASTVAEGVNEVCAHVLQYGLLEQGRLFGVPDPTGAFIIDKRAGRYFPHFLAPLIYNALYVNPVKGGGKRFHFPNARLEVYIAYRLAGTTIWGQIAAAVTGYFALRAVVPILVLSLRLLRVKDQSGNTIKLFRPKRELPVYLAVGVSFIAGYWLLLVDPAVQSWYPVTSSCEDWHGSGMQVPSGAYVTTWGKRRFDRRGESVIAIILFVFPFVFFFHLFIGSKCVREEEKAKVVTWRDKRTTVFFWLVLLFLFINLCIFANVSMQTGDLWYTVAKRHKDTTVLTDDFTKDCTMAVFAAFWIGGAIGSVRSRWTIENLTLWWKLVWFFGTILLIWMPMLQAAALLEPELNDAFSGAPKTQGYRYTAYTAILVFFGFASVGVLAMMWELWYTSPQRQARNAKAAEVKEILKARQESNKKGTAGQRAAEILRKFGTVTYKGLDRAGAFSRISAQAGDDRFSFAFSDAAFRPSHAPSSTGPTGFAGASDSGYALRSGRADDADVRIPMLPINA